MLYNLRGSSWLKWDLHIHSKYSKESRARLGVKDIFDKAIEHGISVISITDRSNVDALEVCPHVRQWRSAPDRAA